MKSGEITVQYTELSSYCLLACKIYPFCSYFTRKQHVLQHSTRQYNRTANHSLYERKSIEAKRFSYSVNNVRISTHFSAVICRLLGETNNVDLSDVRENGGKLCYSVVCFDGLIPENIIIIIHGNNQVRWKITLHLRDLYEVVSIKCNVRLLILVLTNNIVGKYSESIRDAGKCSERNWTVGLQVEKQMIPFSSRTEKIENKSTKSWKSIKIQKCVLNYIDHSSLRGMSHDFSWVCE